MNKIIRLFVFMAALLSGPVSAFIDPPVLEPNPAQQGEEVNLLIRTGDCDGIEEDSIQVLIAEQEITVGFSGTRNGIPDGCGWPIVNHEIPLGGLAPGEYTVTVQMSYEVAPVLINIVTIDVLNLEVQAPTPHAVPLGDMFAWLVLGLILLVVGWIVIRRRQAIMAIPLILLIAHMPDSTAQTSQELVWVQAVLAGGPEAPTPKDIVEAWDFAASSAPTPSLAASGAVAAAYALPFQAKGDFRTRLLANPDSPRARLERSVLLAYPAQADREAKVDMLLSDANIEAAWVPVDLELSSGLMSTSGTGHYGGAAMNIDVAWQWAGGHAFVGVIDSGLFTNHEELRPFSPAQGGTFTFTRGNFLPALSADIGRMKFWANGPAIGTPFDLNVDELQPELVQESHPSCPTDANGYASVDRAGHGTHVAGLLGANAYNGTDTRGVCKHCGIGMWRATYARCESHPDIEEIQATLNSAAVAAAITALGDIGAQVINMSSGGYSYFGTPLSADPCAGNLSVNNWAYGLCLALDYVSPRETVFVASSGNDRRELNFPARDRRVVAVGGIDEQMELWDEDPSGIENCPLYGFGSGERECGSNWTTSQSQSAPKQEVVAAARQVFGLMYEGYDHNDRIGCGDSFGPGSANDGYGICTGTSMSAPQISGIFGILRSVNPLVGVGDPWDSGVKGVRDVLAETTFQSQNGDNWDQELGWGIPDAAAAVRTMLGLVGGETIRNRVTPLFGFYSSGADDHAYTTSPQLAIALIINHAHSYAPLGASVPGYGAFPPDPLLELGTVPRANTFVLTSEHKARSDHPDLVPLYLVSRERPILPDEYCEPEPGVPTCPDECEPGEPGCVTDQGGFLLVTTEPELETLHAQGYHYRGIEGYIYEPCAPEQDCVPEGAQRLWRKCNNSVKVPNCATFLESERAAFEANGFTAAFPAGFPMHIGYAYPNADADGDGLIDGFEHLIGTDPALANSDGDGAPDGTEFPMAGVPVSDPCDGPLAHDNCRIDRIFANRFEAGPYLGPGMSATMPMSAAQACAEIDVQLTLYEEHLDEQSSTLSENDGAAWQQHLEEVAAVEEVRDSLDEYCD